MAEEQVRHLFPPFHRLASLHRCAHVGEVEGRGVVGDVGHGHIGIEKLQRLVFLGRDVEAVGLEELLADERYFLVEIAFNLCPQVV